MQFLVMVNYDQDLRRLGALGEHRLDGRDRLLEPLSGKRADDYASSYVHLPLPAAIFGCGRAHRFDAVATGI